MVKCARGGICRYKVTHPGRVWQLPRSAHTIGTYRYTVQQTSMLTEVFAAVESLIQDQYGNYVVQHILGTYC
jgi:hypothetical protein